MAVLLSIVVIGLVFAGLTGTIRFQLGGAPTIVTPGWEIYDQVVGVQQGNTLYSRSSQFTSPNFISAPYWHFDVDDPNYGVPTVEVTIGDIHHVDFSGRDIPNNQAAQTLPLVTRGNHTYQLDAHVYLFTLTIRTIADVKLDHYIGLVSTMPYFFHETSWPKCYASALESGGNEKGQPFDGGAYIAFVINPWRGANSDNSVSAPANYTLTDAWAGVMNSYVLSVNQGQIPNQWKDSGQSDNNNGMPTPNSDAPLMVKGSIAQGNQVPMFMVDNTFSTPAPKVNFDNSVTPDTRINSSVALYLPIYLSPGARTHNNFWGITDTIYPADDYVMYTVRVDVLQTHDFTLQTAVQPPTPKPPVDFYTWSQDWWTSFLHGIDPFGFLGAWGLGALEPMVWWIITGGIIFLVICIFVPGLFGRVFGGVKTVYKGVRGAVRQK